MLTTSELKKYKIERIKQKKLLFNEIASSQKQLFLDYCNLNPYLWDGTGIDEDTIYLIMGEFNLYYVYTKDFDLIFKHELKKHYPIYRQILKAETKDEIWNLSTNIKFKEFADEIIDNSFTHQKGKTTTESESTTTTNSTSDSNDKDAHRETPMSAIGDGTLSSLFEWDDASYINESKTHSTNEGTDKNNENTLAKQMSKIYNIAKKFNTYNTNSKELNQQAVKSIINIVNYFYRNNKSFDYLIEKLKPCFVNVYE